jgi:hypothetical protein
MARYYDANELGGNQIGTPYDGIGDYNPFAGQTINDLNQIGGGGGGGSYTPPVEPNPLFVPPTYAEQNSGSLKINLVSAEASEFLENDNLIGIGVSQTIIYSPSLTFGTSKIYKANIANKISKNYFEVSIKRTHFNPLFEPNPVTTIPFDTIGAPRINDIFNQSFNNVGRLAGLQFTNVPPDSYTLGNPTAFDINYRERIRIQEFVYNEVTKGYEAGDISALESVNGIVNLNFSFITPDIGGGGDGEGDGGGFYAIDPVIVNYNIDFISNYTNELGEFINLDFQIVDSTNTILDSGICKLSDGNIDERSTDETRLNSGIVNIKINESYETARLLLNSQNLPEGFTYANIYWAPKVIWERTKNEVFTAGQNDIEGYAQSLGWNKANKFFKVSGKEFASGIVVGVIFNKQKVIEIVKYKPVVTIINSTKEFEVKDSDIDKIIRIPFTTTNTEYVDVYISDTPIRVAASNGFVEFSFQNDFLGLYGSKRIYFVPWNQYGRGETVSDILIFNPVSDFPTITQITLPETIDIPAFSDLNVDFDVEYDTNSATSVDIFILNENKEKVPLISSAQPNGSFTVNLRTLITKFLNGKELDLVFVFVPYNRGGAKELIGNEYEVSTIVTYPKLNLDESQIKNAIFGLISENLKFNELAAESKYLTHLVNFGNNEQIIISSWEEDDWTLSEKKEDGLGNLVITNKVDSILLKLYSPLPANIGTNSTLWITKLMSNPLIETIVLNEQDSVKCPPIKGPNFDIEVDFVSGKSTAFESLDNLILDASTSSSSNLISTYLSSSLINTDDLNIEYYSGSNYLTGSLVWENFVHFSSAKERVDNFVYKVQLIENYEAAISSSNYDINSRDSISAIQERERQLLKKNQLVNNFDGFEKFLYTSSSLYSNSGSNSITWPYSSSIRLSSTTTAVSNWYENLIELAENYDSENQNYLKNNIPQYILNNNENDNFLLFFSMIGHHFDNIYYYTKSLEKNREFGYKLKGGMPDKLLFDTLKSFGWDAKNLAVDEKLWKYVYGQDSDGNVKESNPAKARTNEIWRRIINNLPYLLKHKGTRRGVYAIMACYGVPSSNLSILEFGGPEGSNRFSETEEVGTTKLLMDNVTHALTVTSGAKLEVEWKNTNIGEKPKTIELFLKPAYSQNSTIISGSAGWNIQISGSVGSEYGVIKYNSGSTNIITSDSIPIFNNRFFGLCLSSGSMGMKLDVKQVEKDKNIFEYSYSSSLNNNFGNQTNRLYFGWDYSGSIDEIRLWSTQLSASAFHKHVYFPEAINGNHISSSTTDLYFRLDFEYPKNLAQTSSLLNVDANVYFSGSLTRNDYENIPALSGSLYSENSSPLLYATASQFSSSTLYPYNFETVERTISLEIPNIGASRYSTNKVRFESQMDVFGNDVSGGINLSSKSRTTKKAFDQSPVDSNRIGLFFSPTKEMNIDIAKSFGGINLDDYIGDPSDEYRSNYKSLQNLRKYYFQRFDGRDVYQYINLIKSYEKSLFDDIKKMLPARVRATTGLLIEPHILERSKIEQSKPTGSNYQQESNINTTEHIVSFAENNQFESNIDANLNKSLFGENNQYEAIIYNASVDNTSAENYQYETPIYVNDELNTSGESYQKEVNINAELGDGTILTELDIYDLNTVAGQSDLETIGFGIYAQSGSAIRTYFDKEGRRVKERIRVNLVTEQKQRDIVKYKVVVNGQGDPRGGMELTSSLYTETKLNIQPFSGSTIPAIGGSIIDVKPVSGYLKTHYKNTSDLTRGLENSFYRGSRNTAATTLDGTPPVETFTTNPNTLKVNKAGRDASEPILEIE